MCAPAPGFQVVVPGARRPHHPMPMHWTAGTELVTLPCVCGWRSSAESPTTLAGSPAALVAQHAAHVASLIPVQR